MSVAELEVLELEREPPTGLWAEARYRLLRNPGALLGAFFVTVFVTVAVFAPWIAPYGPKESNLDLLHNGEPVGPTSGHWFGIDLLGRDEFSRIVYGARYSLLIGIVSVSIGLSIGLVLGATAGYLGGKVDTVIMRCMDVMLAIPGLLFAIGIVAALQPGLWQVMLAVGIVNIPIFARLLRGSVLAQKENDFVLAARSVGVRRRNILFSHVLPNAVSPLIVQSTLAMATAIIDVAGLGFLGLGPQDPSTPGMIARNGPTERYSFASVSIVPHSGVDGS
jgi:peptide/nickel transport system permease protein